MNVPKGLNWKRFRVHSKDRVAGTDGSFTISPLGQNWLRRVWGITVDSWSTVNNFPNLYESQAVSGEVVVGTRYFSYRVNNNVSSGGQTTSLSWNMTDINGVPYTKNVSYGVIGSQTATTLAAFIQSTTNAAFAADARLGSGYTVACSLTLDDLFTFQATQPHTLGLNYNAGDATNLLYYIGGGTQNTTQVLSQGLRWSNLTMQQDFGLTTITFPIGFYDVDTLMTLLVSTLNGTADFAAYPLSYTVLNENSNPYIQITQGGATGRNFYIPSDVRGNSMGRVLGVRDDELAIVPSGSVPYTLPENPCLIGETFLYLHANKIAQNDTLDSEGILVSILAEMPVQTPFMAQCSDVRFTIRAPDGRALEPGCECVVMMRVFYQEF
jgi:hypothetical protein